MKKAMSKHHDTVVAFLKSQPDSTFDTIKEGCPKISDIMLRKAVKDLQEEGMIVANDEDGGYVLTSATGKSKVQANEVKEAPAIVSSKATASTEKKKKEDEDLGPATPSGRDYSKYDFNGLKALSKSRLVQAIIKEYVSKNSKASLTKLEEVFQSEQIQKRYGVVQELSKAKKISGTRERYFMKPEDILKIGNQKVVVCNQWSSDTLKPLLVIAKSLGYKIIVSK